MNRCVWSAVALAALCGTAASQSWSDADARRMHNFVEYGAPDPGYVPNAYFVNPTTALPPNAYARRAVPGGLIETAARRVNPFSAANRSRDVVFAPSPYRQPPPASAYRVMRPAFGPVGYPGSYPHAGAVAPMPTGAAIRGVNCPTCPR